MVDNNFTSSPHPLMAFGRDVFVFVKEKNLISSIWIVIQTLTTNATGSDVLPP